ncbi:AKIP1 protein, partial [Acrocephalus arundinaceus]|nr:AKIP1 protein [Acrocephalus arundinaceus]
TSHVIFSVSVAVQKYYGAMAANMCKENEIQHFCKYHGKSAETKIDSTEEEVSSTFFFFSFSFFFFSFFPLKHRRPSKDFYIEVSPGTYSVTAISEDMVEQTHVVDVNAGQSIDVTFVL